MVKNENFISYHTSTIMITLFLILLYLLCFLFLFNKNSEFLALILLLAIHCMFMVHVVFSKTENKFITLPFFFSSFPLPIKTILLVSSIYLLVSMSFIINVMSKIQQLVKIMDEKQNKTENRFEMSILSKIVLILSIGLLFVIYGYDLIKPQQEMINGQIFIFGTCFFAISSSITSLILSMNFNDEIGQIIQSM